MTCSSKYLILSVRENTIFSIYSDLEVNEFKSLSNSDDTVPPTIVEISNLKSSSSFDAEDKSPPTYSISLD